MTPGLEPDQRAGTCQAEAPRDSNAETDDYISSGIKIAAGIGQLAVPR
jgi:hypothetical protein